MIVASAEARCIYIVLSRTNTGIGRLVRLFLRGSRYNHVSAALDGRLFPLYSFSRARKDSPFSGRFVQEYPSRYLATGENVDIKVFRVPLAAQEYSDALSKLDYCRAHREEMLYNLFDAILLPFHRRYPLADAYTCLAFCTYLLGMGDISSIHMLEERLAPHLIYEGDLRSIIPYDKTTAAEAEERAYFERRGRIAAVRDFFALCRGLWARRAGL